MLKGIFQQQPHRFGTHAGALHPARPGDVTDLNRALKAFYRHIADQPYRLFGAQIDDGKGHQVVIQHLSEHPVRSGLNALRLGAGKPRPVAVVTQRIGFKQISRMAVGIQRLQAAILPGEQGTG